MASEENLSSLQEEESQTSVGTEPTGANPAGGESPDNSEIANLFDSMEKLPPPLAQGEIVQGTVLKVTDSEVLLDIGLKTEAALPKEQFLKEDGTLAVAPGETIDVYIEHYDEMTGALSVSHQRAVRTKVWEQVEHAFNEGMVIRGRVTERIKGGLTVDIGVPAFLPGSHADVRPHPNLDGLAGQEIECKIIKLNRGRNNVVVSRKAVLEEQLNRRKATLREQLAEGAVLSGLVKNLTDYGVFVDLGGIDGLLHITDLSWGRVGHPSEVVQVGQEIQVKVLKYDPEKERVSLGLKQLGPDPWAQVAETYQPGAKKTGRVVSVTDYGAFVELEPGVEGLIHISEMTWSRRLRHPSKIVRVGETVEVSVLDLNSGQRRISLSLKQTLPDPWTTVGERYQPGKIVQGRVRNLTDFGAFVELEDGVDGLIHVSNLSWSKGVKKPEDLLKKGEKVQAVVINIDPTNRRLALGIKQLQPDSWEKFFSSTTTNSILRGNVTRLADFGAFVELAEGVEGLCHKSEYDTDFAGNLLTRPEVGATLNWRVVKLNPTEKRIGLSLKGIDQEVPEAEESKPHAKTAASGDTTT
jgi:small subunit ribosomal protein S1